MTAQKKGAPTAGLYFICRLSEFSKQLQQLRQIFMAINRSAYEKNMHVVEIVAGDGKGLQDFIDLVQGSGLVALVRGDVSLAVAADADGVMLEPGGDILAARKALGEEGIVGLRCGKDFLQAEKALDAEVDFVAFSAEGGVDICARWAAKTEKPCVIEGSLSNDNCAGFVVSGATFVNATDYIFGHKKGVMQGTVNMLYAIDLASAPGTVN